MVNEDEEMDEEVKLPKQGGFADGASLDAESCDKEDQLYIGDGGGGDIVSNQYMESNINYGDNGLQ